MSATTILRMAAKRIMSPKAPFTVCVEGNVGSGKTTFLNYFNANKDVAVFSEPIDIWRNCDGHNLFKLMYEDPKRWSFTFQSYVQLTMIDLHQKLVPQPVKMMERSIYSARYCFVEKMAQDGIMPAPAVAVIDQWFQYLVSKPYAKVDLIVYLRTSPEVAYKRILERNRSEEKAISLNYIKALHQLHEDWLFHKSAHTCPGPVIVMDADLDKSVIVEEYEKYGKRILERTAM